MKELWMILVDIILPIFVLLMIGFVIQRKIALDVQTLARLSIYFLVPGFIFVRLYETVFDATLFLQIFAFFMILLIVLFIISQLVGTLLGMDKKRKTVFSNSILFYNSGNYGIPVNDLVFKSDPLAMSIQVIILTLQNMTIFSYGIFSLRSADLGKMRALLGYFKMPVLYAMLAGILLNVYAVPIPSFIWIPANYIADAMVAIALVTLGAQVAELKITKQLSTVYVSVAMRLLLAPALAFLLILLFGLSGIVAQALFISSAMPTSVNSSVIAQEYDNHPQLAAQIVLFSTLMSTLTVTVIIYLSRLLF